MYLARLDKRDHATDDRSEIAGEGRFNERPFEITGRFGTVEDALLAARPFPVELSLTLPGLEAALGGSVANLPHGEGFDLEISARSASIGTLLDGLALDRFVEGSAEVFGRLSGDLDALSLTDVSFDLLTNEGRRLHAEGAIGDLIGGNGLDLRFGGLLSGDAKVLQALPAALQDLDEIELAGHVTGDLESLELEDFEGRLTHSSGAELNVTGGAAIELSDDRRAISAATLRGTLSLPDPSLLENLSGTELPPIGPMQASGDLVLTDHEISIETFRAELAEFAGLVLVARGRLGTLASFTEGFSLDPDLAFSASMEKSLPVLAFAERQFPELGPIELAGRLSHGESGFHVQYLRAEFGSRDRLWAAFDGDLGPIRPDQEQPIAALSGTLRFAWPSTADTALLLGQTVPELGAVEGRLSVSGTPEVLRFSDVRIEARSTDGLESSARGEVGRITFDPKFAVGAVRLDLNAKSESTDLVGQLLGHAWPELGEVRASSRLYGGPDIFALDELTVSVGPADQPLLRVAGAIKDLVALKGIRLDGEFKVPAARFLRSGPPEDAVKLGELQGRFDLSDADGTIGLEVLSIEVVGSNLLTASLEGSIDDIANTDELSLQASLGVPDPAALGEVFGMENLDLASLAFEGRLSGSDEAFTVEGETRVGKTALTGTMTGSFAGERPKFVARLTSPVFYFEDFGLTPEPDAAAGEQQ
ncbi:MAG: hypothetical protein V3T64_06805, partial [Myxococcota bacterium]